MKVIMISTDRKIFEEGSAVRARMVEYASLFDELHVIVFCRRNLKAKSFQIAANCRIYPTNSWSRWFYVSDAVRIGRSIVPIAEQARNGAGKDKMPDVSSLVISGQDPFECGLAAARLARRLKARLHIQIHTDFLSPYFRRLSFLNRFRVHLARRVLPQAHAIRVVSGRVARSLTAYSLQLKASPVVLPIFTDIGRYAAAKPAIDLKQKYPQWDFIMLAVGRLSREKNFSFALEILREVSKKYPRVGLVIVGSGPQLRSLQITAKRFALSASAAFEPWRDDLISYYKTANLFILPSLYEGFGLVLLEALASGCPAVSSDVGIASELLVHKGHSFVCPVNDAGCFAAKITELIEDNQLRTFLATQISAEAVVPFQISKEEYLAKYRQSVASALAKIQANYD